jgi:hypothetical protein
MDHGRGEAALIGLSGLRTSRVKPIAHIVRAAAEQNKEFP